MNALVSLSVKCLDVIRRLTFHHMSSNEGESLPFLYGLSAILGENNFLFLNLSSSKQIILVEQVLIRYPVASDGRYIYIKKEKDEKHSSVGLCFLFSWIDFCNVTC